MAWSRFVRNALLALALAGFGAPPVDAVEIVGGAQVPGQISDGWLTPVRNVRHGGGGGVRRPGGVHRPPGGGHRPVHRPAAASTIAHRPPSTAPAIVRR